MSIYKSKFTDQQIDEKLESLNNLKTKDIIANDGKTLQEIITELQQPQNTANLAYPVGSIYISVSSTSPSLLFGGIWEQITGRFLLACNSSYMAGSTGGEISHILTIDEMPSHAHSCALGGNFNVSGGYDVTVQDEANDRTLTKAFATGYSGGGQAHNNMPPYLAVYMWKRIS